MTTMPKVKEIAAGAVLSIDDIWADYGDGEARPLVGLLVDGQPTRAVERVDFLALFKVTEAEPEP